jgi:Fur family ferric uptake transcriptional regulator
MTMDADALIAALGRAGVRVTAPRREVAELIAAREGPFTAADLVGEAQTAGQRLGRATIFRTIDLFSDLGLLERLDPPGGDHAYVVCRPAHHHHLICTRCGRTSEVEDLGLREALDEVERRSGYRIDDHRLELYGTCPSCLRGAA